MTADDSIRVGRVPGGWAYWCSTCKTGRAAKTGIYPVDATVIDQLADEHSFDFHEGRA